MKTIDDIVEMICTDIKNYPCYKCIIFLDCFSYDGYCPVSAMKDAVKMLKETGVYYG